MQPKSVSVLSENVKWRKRVGRAYPVEVPVVWSTLTGEKRRIASPLSGKALGASCRQVLQEKARTNPGGLLEMLAVKDALIYASER